MNQEQIDVYVRGWSNYDDSRYDPVLEKYTIVFTDQDAITDFLTNAEEIWYEYIGGWEGDAFGLFRKEGKLYEINGSHCSCYGLEGQFSPEEVTIEELDKRLGANDVTLAEDDYRYRRDSLPTVEQWEELKIKFEL